MKIKTNELSGIALNWAVAKCEGMSRLDERVTPEGVRWAGDFFQPSKHWSEGGPIIERIKGFEFKHWLESKPENCCEAHIHNYDGDWVAFGPTPLIAAMRCFVASRLGEEVEVPDELS